MDTRSLLRSTASFRRPTTITSPCADHGRATGPPEQGAILILALVFILIVSLSTLGLITFGGVGIKDATSLQGQRSMQYAADGSIEAAIQAVRYSYLPFGYPPVDCLPDGAILTMPDNTTMPVNGQQMVVDCAATVLPSSVPPRPLDRIIAFYACPTSGLVGSPPTCFSGNAVVAATIDFQDVSASGVHQCSSATNEATCGTGVATISWVIQNADN
jgi:hypothetical protein